MSLRSKPPTTGRPVVFTAERKALACAEYAHSNGITHAARAAGVSYQTLKRHLANDPEFAAAWEEADQAYCQMLLDSAHQRGVIGWEEVKRAANGTITSEIQRYSDTIFMALLKAKMPSLFNPAQVIEQTIKTPKDEERIDPEAMTPAQRQAARRLLGQDVPDVERN